MYITTYNLYYYLSRRTGEISRSSFLFSYVRFSLQDTRYVHTLCTMYYSYSIFNIKNSVTSDLGSEHTCIHQIRATVTSSNYFTAGAGHRCNRIGIEEQKHIDDVIAETNEPPC